MKKNRHILDKCPTGISGLDEITRGGLPRGRPSLISGGPGCGKTVLAMEFLVKGITQYNEPGVFMAFEEAENELVPDGHVGAPCKSGTGGRARENREYS